MPPPPSAPPPTTIVRAPALSLVPARATPRAAHTTAARLTSPAVSVPSQPRPQRRQYNRHRRRRTQLHRHVEPQYRKVQLGQEGQAAECRRPCGAVPACTEILRRHHRYQRQPNHLRSRCRHRRPPALRENFLRPRKNHPQAPQRLHRRVRLPFRRRQVHRNRYYRRLPRRPHPDAPHTH